eukprot:751138-Hanusia_phi.AAC.1
MLIAFLLASLVYPASPQGSPAVQILHPAHEQIISAGWQDILIASIQHFDVPGDGTVAVYIDNHFAIRLSSWHGSLTLPVLLAGEHEIALSLQDNNQDVLAESLVTAVYIDRSRPPPLWNFAGGFPDLPLKEVPTQRQQGPTLSVIWTCPDWEIDWVSEMLQGAGVAFRVVVDSTFRVFVNNSLVALSQNDERGRHADVFASYLIEMKRRGLRVGVLHMSDEDYSASSYFYPWVDYVVRNHFQEQLSLLPHTLAIPLGYKKGLWEEHELASNLSARYRFVDEWEEGRRRRSYVWNFVGQTHDKPTRTSMLTAARRVEGGSQHERLQVRNFSPLPPALPEPPAREVLLLSTFTLCPRGFVHPESFRLSEALESGSIPLVEEDVYFEKLFGADHPLIMLPPPPNCSVPRTTKFHPPPHPRPECADVWSGVDQKLKSLLADAPSIRKKLKWWWRQVKQRIKRRVRSLVLTGLPDREMFDGGYAAEKSEQESEQEGDKERQEQEQKRQEQKGQEQEQKGQEQEQEQEQQEQEQEQEREQEQEEQSGRPTLEPSSDDQPRCGHHDLACRARLRYAENQVLTENILEARKKLQQLFPHAAGSSRSLPSPLVAPDSMAGVHSELVRDQVIDWSIGAAEEDRNSFGRYPRGCQDDCDCPGAFACVDGACDRYTRGACRDSNNSFVHELFDAILVVNMNDTEVDRARWEESQARRRRRRRRRVKEEE